MTDRKTLEDVKQLVGFIRVRVRPLRDMASMDTYEFCAFQALLDLVAVMEGAAEARAQVGKDVETLHFHLVVAARQWQDHPDFLPAWAG